MTAAAPAIDEDAPVEPVEDDESPSESGNFSLVLVDEGAPTVDGRQFEAGVVTWREPPIPLLYKTTNSGHADAAVGGAITDIWREGDKVMGKGHFESGPNGQDLRRLIQEGVLTGVSADVGGAKIELEADEDGNELNRITAGRIIGVTALPLQAFDDTRIAVTASAIPSEPPSEWFQEPDLDGPTPMTITADGQVFGHAAIWGTCHVGVSNKCLTPPHSMTDYAHFRIGSVLTAEGDTVATGPITLGTGHANVSLGSQDTRSHYDDTGTGVADVVAGEDAYGVWVAGALRPTMSDERMRELRASALSGDWRSVGGNLELVALLAVNVPGFPIPRVRAGFSDEKQIALVAAGVVEDDCGCDETETDDFDTKLARLELAVSQLVGHRQETDVFEAEAEAESETEAEETEEIEAEAEAEPEPEPEPHVSKAASIASKYTPTGKRSARREDVVKRFTKAPTAKMTADKWMTKLGKAKATQ